MYILWGGFLMRKKLFTSILSAALFLSATPVFAIQLDKPKQFKVDGYVNKQGIEYVKVTDVAKALGLNVKWNPETKTVTISDKDGNVSTGVPDIVNGKSYLPEGFFNYQNKYKATFDWNSKNKTMTVNSNNIVNSNNTTTSYNNNNNTTTTITNSNIGNTNSFNQNSFNTTTTINVNGELNKEVLDDIKNQPNEIESRLLDDANNGNWESIKNALDNNIKFNINAIDKEGYSLLGYAVIGQNLDMVKKLIDNGANVNQKLKEGYTPLHLAALNSWANPNDISIVQELLSSGAKTSLSIENDEHGTPFEVAMPSSKVQYLLDIVDDNAESDLEKNTMMRNIYEKVNQ